MSVKPARLLILGIVLFSALSAVAAEQDVRNSIALGARVFADNCRKCHQIDGYGEEALYPSLHKPALLADKTRLIDTVLQGRLGHVAKGDDGTERLMPSLNFLSNKEIAAVIAFISNSWGGEVLIVTPEEVKAAR